MLKVWNQRWSDQTGNRGEMIKLREILRIKQEKFAQNIHQDNAKVREKVLCLTKRNRF